MWTANKIYFNNSDNYIKAYQNNELIWEKEGPSPVQPDNEIWYTSTDGKIVTPYSTTGYGANIISNIYSSGKGVIKFDGPITHIGDSAFYSKSHLKTIVIPEGVTSIGDKAFQDCGYLTNITIPNSVTSFGKSAFSMCDDLINVTIPEGVTSINESTFSACFSLRNIIIPSSVTNISALAFLTCDSLTTITIPSRVTNIGFHAFFNCKNLTSIIVKPSTPPKLSDSVFYNTNNCPIYVPANSVNAYKAASQWNSYASRIRAISQ